MKDNEKEQPVDEISKVEKTEALQKSSEESLEKEDENELKRSPKKAITEKEE